MILTNEHHLEIPNSSGIWSGELQSPHPEAMPVGKLPKAN